MYFIVKNFLILLLISLGFLFVYYKTGPYKIETVCFGDVCPDNGGTYLIYKKEYTKEECVLRDGRPIVGFGWSEVYAGCSPDNFFSRLTEAIYSLRH